MARDTYGTIESSADVAEGLIAQGRFEDAERHYRNLVAETHVIDYEYDEWLRRLAEVYRQLGRHVEAGFVYLYLHWFDVAREHFRGHVSIAHRARILDVEKRYSDAAGLYAQAQMPVHAAVAFERAERFADAARTWESLMKHPGLRDRDYEQALVYFNYGMAQSRIDSDSQAGRRSLIDAQRRLEQVADDFETRGERERAFDCYQILLKLGRDSGQFENLAEGYINCIRVLKEDNLKFYVLQFYEDFIELALERQEFHAAATLFQEAADYSVRTGLPYHRRYQAQAADTWARSAEAILERGRPAEMAENALLAAISCYSGVDDYLKVRESFERLSKLPLSDKHRARYQKIASRYAAAARERPSAPALPDYLRQRNAYADVWFADLLEWELGGDPRRVAASIVGDLRFPNGIRRCALLVVLTMADAAMSGTETAPELLGRVTEPLSKLQYAALNVLERFYEHDDPLVRQRAVEALRFLYFKRSFGIIRRALEDREPNVRQAAIRAFRELHFPHAFNPLANIYRDSDDIHVQSAALESIGKIQSLEAGEFLIMVMRQEEEELRQVAKDALANLDNDDIFPILRHYLEIETNPELRTILSELVQRGAEQAAMRGLR
ncbi:MAG: hypothetical protein Tsb0020_43510 [Haliangiales bacterium]